MSEEDIQSHCGGYRTLPIKFDLNEKPYEYPKKDHHEILVLVPRKDMALDAARLICSEMESRGKQIRKKAFKVKNTVNDTDTPVGYIVDQQSFDLFKCCGSDLVFNFIIETESEREKVFFVDNSISSPMLVS